MNYATLIALLPSYIGRPNDTNISTNAPTFVALFEAKANRSLRLNDMLERTSGTIATEYLTAPTDMLAIRSFTVDGDAISYLSPEQVDQGVTADSSTGTPLYYTIIGSEIRLFPAPSASVAYALTYYQRIPSLQTNSTNWLGDNHPDLYLYGTALEAALFMSDSEETEKFAGLLKALVEDLARSDTQPHNITPIPDYAI